MEILQRRTHPATVELHDAVRATRLTSPTILTMPDPLLTGFDNWLWSAGVDTLGEPRLAELAMRATAAGVEFGQLTVLTVISEGPSPAAVLSAARGVHELRSVGQLELIRAETGDRGYVVAVWPTNSPGVFHLTGSVPVTDDAWERVEGTWMNTASSRLAPVILNRFDFDAIGDALAEHGSIETARMTARVLRDHSSYTRGWPQRPGLRRPSHMEALSETGGMLVKTLTLDVAGRTRIQLRRTSGASFLRGDFGLFVDVVLGRLTRAARERRELLDGRQRVPLAPVRETVSIAVDRLDLGDPRVRADLLNTLTSVRGLQAAVLHENPYLHVLATDFFNGSTFDVLITDDGRLDIVPGLRSSVGSLARVTDALGAVLGMRDISLREVSNMIPDDELLSC